MSRDSGGGRWSDDAGQELLGSDGQRQKPGLGREGFSYEFKALK